MNTLLIYFALPVATIILAIVLQKILKCPILTAATFFAIYLIVTFAAFDASFLVYAIIYTILAFIAAYLAQIIFKCKKNECICNGNVTNTVSNANNSINTNNTSNVNNLCNNCNDSVTANIRNNNTGCQSTWCCYRR